MQTLRFLAECLGRLTWWQIGLVLLHLLALGGWWWKSTLGEMLPDDGVSLAVNVTAGVLGGLGPLALLIYQTLPQPSSERARPQFDRWSVVLHLTYTWSLATCLAVWAFHDYAVANQPNAHEEALKVWFLALGFFGGFLNLTRSTGTRSTTATIHATTSRMARDLDRLRRGQQTNAELYAQAVEAQLATTREGLGAAVLRMVDAARAHPTIPPDRLTVSLWVRGQHQWRILAGSGIGDATQLQFTQEVQTEPTSEAGVVASLAASDQRLLIDPDIEEHPWYKVNPNRPAEHSGMAVILIENFQGEPIAALCLTSRPGTLLPSEANDPEAHTALVRLLMAWKIAFTLPMVRLMHMRSTEESP